MATTPTTKKLKNKKPLPVKLEDDLILGAPIQDEILKRIGEQAKDWEETPRPPRRETPPAPVAASPKQTKTTSMGLPAWTLAVVVVVLGAGFVWLNGRTLALEHSLTESNAMVRGIKDKIADLGKAQAETQTQVETMSDAFAAAASAKVAVHGAAVKPVGAPAPAATPASAQNSAIKTK